jgi:orotate phosphoribosyltransferase
MDDDLLDLMRARRGHFRLESGHHGDLWLEPDAVFDRPNRLAPFLETLAELVEAQHPDVVCGPLTGGAFVALQLARRLDADFCYTERTVDPSPGALYSARYTLGGQPDLAGRRVAVVDDVINAGSATRSTLDALGVAGAEPVAIATLLALGDSVYRLAEQQDVTTAFVATRDNTLWKPEDCPLCHEGVAVDEASSTG